jgi:hypothetical protein
MQFLYNGFKQEGNNRCYCFDAKEGREPATMCRVWIDLSLFTKYRISLQTGPGFCLQLLQTAWAGGDDQIKETHDYRAIDKDFTSLLSERAARLAIVAAKRPPRRPFRKPPLSSHLGRSVC